MMRRTFLSIVGICLTAGAAGQDSSLLATSDSLHMTDKYSQALSAMLAAPGFPAAVETICRGMGSNDFVWDGKHLNFDMWFDDPPIVMSTRCGMRPLRPDLHVTAWKGTVDVCALIPGMDDVRQVILQTKIRLPEECELGTRTVAEVYRLGRESAILDADPLTTASAPQGISTITRRLPRLARARRQPGDRDLGVCPDRMGSIAKSGRAP